MAGILGELYKTGKKSVFISILINIIILGFVAGILYVQFTADLTLLESRLLNLVFIIPIFLALVRYGLLYGLLLGALALACHVFFPDTSAILDLRGLIILCCQIVSFILMSSLIGSIRKNEREMAIEISEKNELVKKSDTRSNNDLLEVLVKVIDAKDSYTYQHSKRVAYYAKCLALSNGFSEEASERVYVAGMLHDVGKIGMNESILNKSTMLTEQEKQEASRHPVVGARIAENLNCFKDVIPAIYYHHEVYNGTGYPEGLKGDKIPLAARILSIADAFDAMTSNRSYRIGMTVEEAVKRMVENIGNQFDPHLVVSFIDLIKNKGIFIEKTALPVKPGTAVQKDESEYDNINR